MSMQRVQITTEGTVSATWLMAFFHGLLNTVVMGGGTTLTTYLVAPQDDRWEMSLIVGGVAFFTALGYRGGFEGSYDAARQANGEVKSSDVTPNPPAMVVEDTNV